MSIDEHQNREIGQVGIFWFFKGELLTSHVPHTLGEEYGDCVNGTHDHVHFWPILQKRLRRSLPTIGDYEYEQVPRGRVIYRKTDGVYLVIGSEDFVRDKWQQRLVLEAFCLEDKPVVFVSDEHYGAVPGMLGND